MKPFNQLRRDLREDVIKQLEGIIKKDESSKITLKNGSQVEIDPDAADHLLRAFKKLSPENQKVMGAKMGSDGVSLMKILDFAVETQNTKGIQ